MKPKLKIVLAKFSQNTEAKKRIPYNQPLVDKKIKCSKFITEISKSLNSTKLMKKTTFIFSYLPLANYKL